MLNARPEESRQVFLLLGQGFFTGIFLATYDVGAVSVFLEHFSEGTLAWAFVASGATGIIFTYLFAFFQARVRFGNLVTGFLLLIAVANVFVWFGLKTFSDFEPIIFIGFIFALPFSYIGLLIFWGTFGRLFSVRAAKRIIGGIDTGQLVASIVALFTIGALLDNQVIVAQDLFLISLISLSGFFIMFYVLKANFPLTKEGEESRKETYPIPKMMKNRYLRLMASFVIISMIAATFVDFAFLNVTKIQWPQASDLGAFVARFEAAVVIFSFLFQTFVTDYMIENYGIKIALLVNPLLIIALTVISGFVGLVYIESDFVWFFLIISITKLFIDSLKDALDGPTFKLYFLPIDTNVRFDVSTKIEGVVTAFASMLAGLILIAMDYMELPLIVVVFALIPILAGWFFVTGNMHINYKQTLTNALESIKGTGMKVAASYKDVISAKGVKENESEAYYSLKLMEHLEPGAFDDSFKVIKDQLKPDGRLVRMASRLQRQDDATRELATRALASVNTGNKLTDKELYDLSKAPNANHKIAAAIHLRENISDENVFVLLDLLRDFSPSVRHEALKTARIVKRDETWNLIAELLDHPKYANEAASALISGGNEALASVNQLFTKSDKSRDALQLAVKIMGDVASHEALEYLWEKIEYPDRKIVREVLVTLQKNHVNAIGEKVQRVMSQLDLEIGKAIWNLAAISELKETEANKLLLESLHREVDSNFEFIYIYLSLVYDAASIQLVKENVESGSSDGITYAIELLEVFIDKELRPKLYPLIEDSPVSEKLEKLQIFFPRITFNELQTLNYIINRDFNMINRWTKACALDALLHQDAVEVNAGLIGHLFNPDVLLAENAAKVIRKIDMDAFNKVVDRLPEKRRYYLRNKFRETQGDEQLGRFPMRFERCTYMMDMNVFGHIRGLHVSEMVDKFQVVRLKAEAALDTDRIRGYSPLIIVESGSVEISNGTNVVVKQDELFTGFFFDVFPFVESTITASEDSVVYLLDMNDFLSVLINYKKLATEVMAHIESLDKHRAARAV